VQAAKLVSAETGTLLAPGADILEQVVVRVGLEMAIVVVVAQAAIAEQAVTVLLQDQAVVAVVARIIKAAVASAYTDKVQTELLVVLQLAVLPAEGQAELRDVAAPAACMAVEEVVLDRHRAAVPVAVVAVWGIIIIRPLSRVIVIL
jgi:hypothetical protein